MDSQHLAYWRFALFFPRRRFVYMRRPWMFRRRYYRRWGCFPGCLTLALLGLLLVGILVAIVA